MRKINKLKVAMITCMVAGILAMLSFDTIMADTSRSTLDNGTERWISLSNGRIDIYPTGYKQNNSELIPFTGKYIITGSSYGDDPLNITNDSDKKVTYDITLKDASISVGNWSTVVRIHADGDTVVNLNNKGNSVISAGHSTQAIDNTGTGKVTVNTHIIDGCLSLYSAYSGMYGPGNIYSEGIIFNSEVEFDNNTDYNIDIKHESKDGTYTIDEENEMHIYKCKHCNKQIKEKHTLSSATSVDSKKHTGRCDVCNRVVTVSHKYKEFTYNGGEYTKECSAVGCDSKSIMTFDLSGGDGREYDYGKRTIVTSSAVNIENMTYDNLRHQWYEIHKENGVDTYRPLPKETGPNLILSPYTAPGEHRYKVDTYVDGIKGTYETKIKIVPGVLEVKMEDIVYGNELKPTINSDACEVKYFYKQKGASDDTYTEIKPEKVGDYTVKAVVEDDTYFREKEAICDFTISPRTIKVTWGETTFVYNGKEQLPKVTIGNVIKGDECNLTITGAQVKVGKGYTAKIVAIDNDNYILPTEGTSVKYDIVEKLTIIKPIEKMPTEEIRSANGGKIDNKNGKTSNSVKNLNNNIPETSDEVRLLAWVSVMLASGAILVLQKRKYSH